MPHQDLGVGRGCPPGWRMLLTWRGECQRIASSQGFLQVRWTHQMSISAVAAPQRSPTPRHSSGPNSAGCSICEQCQALCAGFTPRNKDVKSMPIM